MEKFRCLFPGLTFCFGKNIQELQVQTNKDEIFTKPDMTNVLTADSVSFVYVVGNLGAFSNHFKNVTAFADVSYLCYH